MRSTKSRIVLTLVTVLAFIGSTTVPGLSLTTVGQITFKPIPAPARWRLLIGEYVLDNDTVIVLEKDGKLGILFKRTELNPLDQISKDKFQFPANSAHSADRVEFARDSHGKVTQVAIGKLIYRRKPLGPEEGSNQLRVEPLRPVPTLINEARTSQPPVEPGDFLPTDLVELTKLDPTIKLEIRYATTNNLFGTVFYSEPRAFMQRPAAESVVRVNRKLKQSGYGLLVHDAYRPWYVTKVFWDATPDDKKKFVADPSQGSRHNRGCAVDISLYDLKTGKPIEMVSTYDETTDRAYPDYPVVLRCNVGTATFYVTQCSRRALPCIRRNGGTLITKIGSDTESAL